MRNFDRLTHLQPAHGYQNGQPQIQRRITNYHPEPYVDSSNYIDNFSGGIGGGGGGGYDNAGYQQVQTYQQDYNVGPPNGYHGGDVGGYPQHHPQHHPPAPPHYAEPPEPIIEIIIKESNETLPTPQALPLHNKKKKEQVHVFYVKYKKDEHKGLVIDDPIPGKKLRFHFYFLYIGH